MDIIRTPPCRLDLVFASSAPVAVILRRGPSRRVHMVVWHTKTDQFVSGEWWHGRIYADKCGLSPDGRRFVYFGYQWRPRYVPEGFLAFTAVSSPPNFKPVALWPADSTWGGGGRFLDNRTLCLNYGEGCVPEAHPSFPPRGLEVRASSDSGQPRSDAAFRLNPDDYPGAEWFGKDHAGKTVFTRAGMLYRLAGKKEILLRDFNVDEPPPLQKHGR